jgi:hypothetical protein
MNRIFNCGFVVSLALLGWTGTSYAEWADDVAAQDAAATDDVGYSLCDSQCSECLDDCCDCTGNWCCNTYTWIGADVYKSIGERVANIPAGPGAITSSPGAVLGFNTGFGLGNSRIRGQIGASYGLYDPKGRLGVTADQNTAEEQAFITVGVYKRGNMECDCDRVSWGIVFDQFITDDWGVNANDFNLNQIRGIFGYAINPWNELGVWGTLRTNDALAQVTVAGGGPFTNVRAADQFNLYWKHNTDFGAQLTPYIGFFDNAAVQDWQVGIMAQAPLAYNWSLSSNFSYQSPSATSGSPGSGEEQYNASIGLAYYFGGKAVSRTVTGQQGIPLLNVANNSSFLITD